MNDHKPFVWIAGGLMTALFGATCHADEPIAGSGDAGPVSHAPANPNLPTRTLGGREFWGDVAYCHGWRIQQNVVDGHFRLLDPTDVRRAWGTRSECDAALETVRTTEVLPPMSGKAVILVHGIGRSSKAMGPLVGPLKEDGFTVICLDYPSTRVPIQDSAAYLRQVISSLDGIDHIDLVVHSMGGLVVRSLLAEENPDPRLGRLVMLGVPNRGAEMANLVEKWPMFRLLYGAAGQQLVRGEESFIAELPTPKLEFAIIAGARGTNEGFNPLIPGDDDGTVTVASTRLAGAADFMTVGAMHSFLTGNAEAIAATRRFLKEGALRVDGVARPIPAELSSSPKVPTLR